MPTAPVSQKTFEYPQMVNKIPEGAFRSATIQHFSISSRDATMANLRAVINGRKSGLIEPGKYARLLVEGSIMMTDTPMERATNQKLIEEASGHVLVGGLGFGMVLWPLLAKQPQISSLLVVEENPDVIRLVSEYLPKDSRLFVDQGDIFRWRPTGLWPKFNTIYFDIWPDICLTNIAEARRLRRRAAAWLAPGGWMGDWDTEVRRYDGVKPGRGHRRRPQWPVSGLASMGQADHR